MSNTKKKVKSPKRAKHVTIREESHVVTIPFQIIENAIRTMCGIPEHQIISINTDDDILFDHGLIVKWSEASVQEEEEFDQ